MRIIEITDSKVSEMAEHVENMIRCGKKLYECLEELSDGGFGERGGMGRGGMNMRDDDYDEFDDMGERYYGRYGRDGMGMRRGRSMRTGRYISR